VSDAAEWHPGLLEEGDPTYRAWQLEFRRQGLPYEVLPGSVLSWQHEAVTQHGDRGARLFRGVRRPRLSLSLRREGGGGMTGHAPDVGTSAEAAGRWLSGAGPEQMATAWPFLGSVALARAVERGDQLEARWLSLYENHLDDDRAARVADFIALAYHEPRLRALHPGFSHWILHFRPNDNDIPVVEPTSTPGRYRVMARDRRVLAETDAAGALSIVLDALPE
jgi:hypothetical protein